MIEEVKFMGIDSIISFVLAVILVLFLLKVVFKVSVNVVGFCKLFNWCCYYLGIKLVRSWYSNNMDYICNSWITRCTWGNNCFGIEVFIKNNIAGDICNFLICKSNLHFWKQILRLQMYKNRICG